LAKLPGVISDVPLTCRATLARIKGKRLRTVVLGLPIENVAGWEALSLTEGRPAHASGEAVLSADVAKSIGAKLGDRVTIIARPAKSATLVGFADAGALAAFAPATSLVMPIADVQQAFRLTDQL